MWEIFAGGAMPYTQCSNQEVANIVLDGGRLDIPPGTPAEMASLMMECWQVEGKRPTFRTINILLGQ